MLGFISISFILIVVWYGLLYLSTISSNLSIHILFDVEVMYLWILFFNTSTANYEYSGGNTDNLALPTEMQLSEKPKTFCQFCYIFRIYIKFWTFWNKNESHSLSISTSYWLQETCLLKCIKSLFSESSLAVNLLKSPKNCCNLQKITFIWLLYDTFTTC